MSDIWFEEELTPTVESLTEVTKQFATMDLKQVEQVVSRVTNEARGKVLMHTPQWKRLTDTRKLLTSGGGANFYQVRLGFEVEIARAARAAGAHFTFALCSARLWSVASGAIQPSVYDLYPAYLDEGEAREVAVELGPEVKVGEVGASLGKISSDVRVGRVEPVIVGWKGAGEREPHWELRPQSKELLGVRNMWLLLQIPEPCQGARLAVQVEGDIQTHWGPIAVGPVERVWDKRKMVVIR